MNRKEIRTFLRRVMHKKRAHFRTENFSSGFSYCGDVFDFLPGSELILAPCAFYFVAVLSAPDCRYNEFWDGRTGAFVRLRTAVLMLSPL